MYMAHYTLCTEGLIIITHEGSAIAYMYFWHDAEMCFVLGAHELLWVPGDTHVHCMCCSSVLVMNGYNSYCSSFVHFASNDNGEDIFVHQVSYHDGWSHYWSVSAWPNSVCIRLVSWYKSEQYPDCWNVTSHTVCVLEWWMLPQVATLPT